MRLQRYLKNQATTGTEHDTRHACNALVGGNTTPFVVLLEKFLQSRPVRTAISINEPAFQAIFEAICMETSPCFPELCLLVDPTKKYGHGKYGFVDLFFTAAQNSYVRVLELKIVSLKDLWMGTQSNRGSTPSTDMLRNLQKKLMEESEEQMMRRQYTYWDKDGHCWCSKSLDGLKEQAVQQVNRYLGVLCQGQAANGKAGILDRRICCETGEDVLIAYVILCVGATRVLSWEITSMKTKFTYVPFPTNLV